MKKLISLLVSVVLTVTIFTTAYATEGMTAASEVISPVAQAGVTQEETGIAQNETQETVQTVKAKPKNDQLSPEEIGLLRELIGLIQEEYGITAEMIQKIVADELVQEEIGEIIQREYSMVEEETGDITQTELGEDALRQMVIEYAMKLYAQYTDVMLPPVVITQQVDQFIAFLQYKRARFEALAQNTKAQINFLKRCIGEVPFSVIIFLPMILIYGALYIAEQSLASQCRALIEAKQHYHYKLDGSEVMPIVQEEFAPKKR